MRNWNFTATCEFGVASSVAAIVSASICAAAPSVNSGPAAYGDFRAQAPGKVWRITASDLPEPHASDSVDNDPKIVPRPKGAWPTVVSGYKVQLFASGFDYPRLVRTAPNGDVFVAESHLGELRVLRGISRQGTTLVNRRYVGGLTLPFGIAFYPLGPNPRWLYVANTDCVVRFPYKNGDLEPPSPAEHVIDLPGGGHLRGGGHWTRDIAFSLDGKHLYVSVGSHSNNDDTDDNPRELRRADILECDPNGANLRVFASGIRNAVGIAVHPKTGELWASVNERDDLGDNLPPDYITHVRDGGFYGWPWFYIGAHQDPRHAGKHPELKNQVIVPDVLIQPHDASLQMTFYQHRAFKEYNGDIFACQHGSWNRAYRTGYSVIRVPMTKEGRATGEYEDFMTGFVTSEGDVWGRPVGITVASDGSLLVSDDGSRSIWRISKNARGLAPRPQ